MKEWADQRLLVIPYRDVLSLDKSRVGLTEIITGWEKSWSSNPEPQIMTLSEDGGQAVEVLGALESGSIRICIEEIRAWAYLGWLSVNKVEKMVTKTTRQETSEEPDILTSSCSSFPTSRMVKSKYLWWKSPSLCCFVREAEQAHTVFLCPRDFNSF